MLADGYMLRTVHETHERHEINKTSYSLSLWGRAGERGNNAQFISATTLDPVPFLILPLLEKFSLTQRRMTFMFGIGVMMPCIMFQILFVSVITRKAPYYSPERFDLA